MANNAAKRAKQDNKRPSVLAFEKKLVPSDGFLYEMKWDNVAEKRFSESDALKILPKTVRGTASHRVKDSEINSTESRLKATMKLTDANIQTVDACYLSSDRDTLNVRFTLKVLSGIDKPSACNNEHFLEEYKKAFEAYRNTYKFSELAKRYAINIANARYLGRNRVGAEHIRVDVKILNDNIANAAGPFEAHKFSLNNFDNPSDEIEKLANHIAKALSGDIPFILIEVNAYAKVGCAQEVYPSEEFIQGENKKRKGAKSKTLYQVGEFAGIHSQKIGNALRTIDTWYPEFGEPYCDHPIPVEVYGTVTNIGKIYREPKHGDFYSLFDRFVWDKDLPENDQHYVMAVLIRGGVFGESDSKKAEGES